MDVSNAIAGFSPNEAVLKAYGFKRENKTLYYESPIEAVGMKAEFCLEGNTLNVSVYDNDTGDLYTPFELSDSEGGFIGKIREAVERILEDFISTCFKSDNLRAEVLRYAVEKDDSFTENPWKSTPSFTTLKRGSGKWYGLVMDIPKKYLGGESDKIADVINIKLPPNEISGLVDGKGFFPAWHMNKKHWITILLDGTVPKEKLFELIDESYNLVGK